MLRVSWPLRVIVAGALALCLPELLAGQTAIARPAASGHELSSATATAASSRSLNVVFEGTLAGPSDVRRQYTPGGSVKVGSEPCHRQTTEERTRCDSVVDFLAGAAKDDRGSGVEISSPHAIVTDAEERILVTDTAVPGIHVFDMRRKKYALFRLAPENTPLKMAGIAVDAHGLIYVTEPSAGVVLVYNAHGKFQHTIGEYSGGERLFEQPSGIAVERATGRIYLADAERNYLFILDQNGRVLKKIGRRGGGSQPDAFSAPRDVVISGSSVYVLDSRNQRIQVLDTDGNFKDQIALDAKASCLAIGNDGTIYLGYAAGGAVAALDIHTRQSLGNFGRPAIAPIDLLSGLWVAPDGRIYVANLSRHRIDIFRASSSAPRR